MANTVTLQPQVIARLQELGSQIAGLIKTGTAVRIWFGEKDLKNPKTNEVIGKQKTSNFDVAVPQATYESVSKAIEISKNSGHYVALKLSDVEMVAIATRHDELKDRFIVQFAKPNTGSWDESNSQDFETKFAKAFASGETKIAQSIADDNEVPF